MKFSGVDLGLLRWSLAAMGASILLSGIILYSSSAYTEFVQKDNRAAQNQLREARSRLTMALQDRENLSTYSREYAVLEQHKIFGDDHRLDWMEGYEKLRQQNLLPDFSYTIAPQKIHVPQPAIDSGNFDIQYSEAKMQFDLLHEGQLLKFFAALRGRNQGWYQLEGCTLQRVAADTAAPATRAQIKAECSGGWVTLKNRNAAK